MVERLGSRFGSNVEQNANIGVQRPAESIEEPTMRVQLLLIALFQAEDHLAGHNALLGALELEIGIQGDLCRVLVDVGCDLFLVDVVLRNALLKAAHGSDRVQCSRMDLSTSVGNDAHDNLLPSVLAPGP
jgi:hypothetical protein